MIKIYLYKNGVVYGPVDRENVSLLADMHGIKDYTIHETRYEFNPNQLGACYPYLLTSTGEIIPNPNYEAEKASKELEALKAQRLTELRDELSSTDYWCTTDNEERMTSEEIKASHEYRAKVRQLNHDPDFPWLNKEIPWPTKPTFLEVK